MKLTAKQALIAMAQVYEDFPSIWTERAWARDERGNSIDTWSPNAVCFCAEGFLQRLNDEGTLNEDGRREASRLLNNYIQANDNSVDACAARWNDGGNGRQRIIEAARASSK